MKIYTKVRMSIETGEVLEEEHFEYDGPIAMCDMGGGGSEVSYEQSPEQAAIYQAVLPLIYQMSAQATGIPYTYTPGSTSGSTTTTTGGVSGTQETSAFNGISGGGEYDEGGLVSPTTTTTTPTTTSSGAYTITGMPAAPAAPTYPSMTGYLTGIEAPEPTGYDVATYTAPDVSSIMPTDEWYNSLSEDWITGLYSSYDEGYAQMLEALGASGISGSAAGLSGAGGAAAGEYWGNASTDLTQYLWEATSPSLMADYNAQLGASQWEAEQQTAQNAYLSELENTYASSEWQNALTESTQNYENVLTQMQQQYESDTTSYWYPYQALTGLAGSTYSDAIVEDETSALDTIGETGLNASLIYSLLKG